jgi:hypothetical protein
MVLDAGRMAIRTNPVCEKPCMIDAADFISRPGFPCSEAPT